MQKGIALWFTGLSGAGKTTISRIVEKKLKTLGFRVQSLDGDEVRRHLAFDLGFSYEDRMTNIRRAAFVAKLLTEHQIIVLASFITPYQEMRDYCRKQIGSYAEIYVKCSLEECIRRDVKGLYKQALAGKIKHFTGISDPFEEPKHPDLILHSDQTEPEDCADEVIHFLKKHQYIQY